MSNSLKMLLAAAGFASLLSLAAYASVDQKADQVIVDKSERKLYLLKDQRVLRTMDVSLGLVPEGDKSYEGDFRTPEGRYRLEDRNPESDFFLSIRISYPSPSDRREARSQGLDPGGMIMIHGQPNNPRHDPDYYRNTDWTDGCIAVSDADMVDIWLMTQRNTPIEIRP